MRDQKNQDKRDTKEVQEGMMEHNTNIVICGFPGVGKSVAESKQKNVIDMEVSNFRWILDAKKK